MFNVRYRFKWHPSIHLTKLDRIPRACNNIFQIYTIFWSQLNFHNCILGGVIFLLEELQMTWIVENVFAHLLDTHTHHESIDNTPHMHFCLDKGSLCVHLEALDLCAHTFGQSK